MSTSRRIKRTALLAVCGLMFTSCVTVDPARDYQRTAQIIDEHTGISQLYSPGAKDDSIQAAVTAMLADGLTVDEAVRIALLNNPRLQALFHEVGVSRADLVQAGLLTNPTLAGSVRFPESGGMANIMVALSQSVIDLVLIPIRKKIARSQLQQTQLRVAQQAVDLVAEVKRASYGLISLQQAEAVTKENLQLAQRSAQVAQRRLDAGEADKLDLNLARSDLLDVQRELLTIQRDRQIAQASLTRALGLARWREPWTMVGELPRPADLPDTDHLLARAASQRLDTRIAELRVAAATEELKREQRSIFSDVAVGFERERPESPPNLSGPTLDVRLPVWHQNQALIAKARMGIEIQKRRQQAVLDEAAADVQRAAAAAHSNAQLVRFYDEKSLPLSRENVQATTRAYERGLHDILRLTQAQRTLIDQRRAYVNVLRDYATALADLEQAIGGRIEPTTPAPSKERDASEPKR